MELDEVEIIDLELKYCERCGGLWLRPLGAVEVYCPPCVPKMMEVAIARPRGKPSVVVSYDHDLDAFDELAVMCGTGGQA